MKRNKKLFSGPTVRYYDYRVGIVNNSRPIFLTVFLPMFAVLFILGGGGLYGYHYYKLTRPVMLSTNEAPPQPRPAEPEVEEVLQKPFQLREDENLADSVQEKLSEMPNHTKWAVSVRDLQTGRMANINADTEMQAASLYKLFLLAPLEKKISADYWKSPLGNQTIGSCVTAMIKVSDNDCPQMLGNYMNWKSIDAHNQSLGFIKTKVNTRDGNITTSREVSELMFRLQNSQILSDKARRQVFDALYEQKYRTGIPAGCGSECLVANKTGDIDGFRHDAAIVTHGEAQYVIVIMSQNGTWKQIGDLAKFIDDTMRP